MNTLIIVDIQNDFCPGGSLAVPDGDKIVPVINKLSGVFDHVLQTQDWHTKDHKSFASSYKGKNAYDTIQLFYGEQILWPVHCVQGTKGAEFHPNLSTIKTELIIRKGFRSEIDSYSAFFENDHKTSTGLAGYLRDRGIDTLYIAGLATDFCVKWSALDGKKLGFNVTVIEDAVKGININDSVNKAWKEMAEAGIHKISSDKIIS